MGRVTTLMLTSDELNWLCNPSAHYVWSFLFSLPSFFICCTHVFVLSDALIIVAFDEVPLSFSVTSWTLCSGIVCKAVDRQVWISLICSSSCQYQLVSQENQLYWSFVQRPKTICVYMYLKRISCGHGYNKCCLWTDDTGNFVAKQNLLLTFFHSGNFTTYNLNLMNHL